MKKIISFLIICFAVISAAYSQEPDEKADTLSKTLMERTHDRSQMLMERLDSIIDMRDSMSKFDTTYIQRPAQNWSFRMRMNVTAWRQKWLSDPTQIEFSLSANPKTTISLGASYRGLSIGLSANISKLFEKSKDVEYSMASYGNKFGFEGFYHYSSDFNANARHGDKHGDVSSIIDCIKMLNISGYYAFNGRKFSFPAAFSQSYIQKRSAGSWLLGVNAFYSETRLIKPNENESHIRLHLLTFGLGGGYGYNWVIKKWLFHVSAVPTIVIAHNNYFDIYGKRSDMKYMIPEFTINHRLAIVRTFGNMFGGLSSVANMNILGKKSKMLITNTKMKVRLFVGIRL